MAKGRNYEALVYLLIDEKAVAVYNIRAKSPKKLQKLVRDIRVRKNLEAVLADAELSETRVDQPTVDEQQTLFPTMATESKIEEVD